MAGFVAGSAAAAWVSGVYPAPGAEDAGAVGGDVADERGAGGRVDDDQAEASAVPRLLSAPPPTT